VRGASTEDPFALKEVSEKYERRESESRSWILKQLDFKATFFSRSWEIPVRILSHV
jgi:hypothetical protein